MKLLPWVVLLVSIGVFAQSPNPQLPPAPSAVQGDDAKAHARAWFAEGRQEDPNLKQVAEEKYLYLDADAAPSATSSHDVWTLWKSPNGEFEISGTLELSDESVPYWIQLTPGMQPAAFKVFRWATTIGCRRTPAKLLCEETNPKGLVVRTARHEINGPTEIFVPMAFFWAGLTRSSEFHAEEAAHFTLLAQGGETETFPVSFSPVAASLRVLRRGKQPIPHGEIDAAEFQLDARDPAERNPPASPRPGAAPGSETSQPYSAMLKLWVAANGILLSALPPDAQEGSVRLVEFKKLAYF